jgi:ABC-type transporter Mla subunit MlaD
MNDVSPPEPNENEDPVARASQRLDQAVEAVARRLQALNAQLGEAENTIVGTRDSDEDRARLAASLDEARAREQELTNAAEEARDALNAAMHDMAQIIGLKESSP